MIDKAIGEKELFCCWPLLFSSTIRKQNNDQSNLRIYYIIFSMEQNVKLYNYEKNILYDKLFFVFLNFITSLANLIGSSLALSQLMIGKRHDL